MRLVTRSDFDGLACGALLLEAGIIDHWKFAHPKDLQDGLVEINEDDCLANVPYVEGCGLWFDHHSSEHERLQLAGKYKGESRIAPSCARIIYEYYGGAERFPQFTEMMEAVDKVDSGDLTFDEVMDPSGWILVGFLMDPRTGLGRWRQFSISNYQLMEKLLEACRVLSTEEILALPDVKERIAVYNEQTEKFKEMVRQHTQVRGNVIITDLRGVDPYLHREPVYDLQHVSQTEYLRMDCQRPRRARVLGSRWVQHLEPYRGFGRGEPDAQIQWRRPQEGRDLPIQQRSHGYRTAQNAG